MSDWDLASHNSSPTDNVEEETQIDTTPTATTPNKKKKRLQQQQSLEEGGGGPTPQLANTNTKEPKKVLSSAAQMVGKFVTLRPVAVDDAANDANDDASQPSMAFYVEGSSRVPGCVHFRVISAGGADEGESSSSADDSSSTLRQTMEAPNSAESKLTAEAADAVDQETTKTTPKTTEKTNLPSKIGTLRIKANGAVCLQGGSGKWATFRVHRRSSGLVANTHKDSVILACEGHDFRRVLRHDGAATAGLCGVHQLTSGLLKASKTHEGEAAKKETSEEPPADASSTVQGQQRAIASLWIVEELPFDSVGHLLCTASIEATSTSTHAASFFARQQFLHKVVILRNEGTGSYAPFQCLVHPSVRVPGCVHLEVLNPPQQQQQKSTKNLRILPNGDIDCNGGQGPWATLQLRSVQGGLTIAAEGHGFARYIADGNESEISGEVRFDSIPFDSVTTSSVDPLPAPSAVWKLFDVTERFMNSVVTLRPAAAATSTTATSKKIRCFVAPSSSRFPGMVNLHIIAAPQEELTTAATTVGEETSAKKKGEGERGKNLRFRADGSVDAKGRRGPWASFRVMAVPSTFNQDKKEGEASGGEDFTSPNAVSYEDALFGPTMRMTVTLAPAGHNFGRWLSSSASSEAKQEQDIAFWTSTTDPSDPSTHWVVEEADDDDNAVAVSDFVVVDNEAQDRQQQEEQEVVLLSEEESRQKPARPTAGALAPVLDTACAVRVATNKAQMLGRKVVFRNKATHQLAPFACFVMDAAHRGPDDAVHFALLDDTERRCFAGGNLRVRKDGSVCRKGGMGPWATFRVFPTTTEEEEEEPTVWLAVQGHRFNSCFLSMRPNGQLASSNHKNQLNTQWFVEILTATDSGSGSRNSPDSACYCSTTDDEQSRPRTFYHHDPYAARVVKPSALPTTLTVRVPPSAAGMALELQSAATRQEYNVEFVQRPFAIDSIGYSIGNNRNNSGVKCRLAGPPPVAASPMHQVPNPFLLIQRVENETPLTPWSEKLPATAGNEDTQDATNNKFLLALGVVSRFNSAEQPTEVDPQGNHWRRVLTKFEIVVTPPTADGSSSSSGRATLSVKNAFAAWVLIQASGLGSPTADPAERRLQACNVPGKWVRVTVQTKKKDSDPAASTNKALATKKRRE